MTRTRVSSSNIASVGYDSQMGILEIEFQSGSVYRYYRVPQSHYQGLMRASSHGQYFDAYIKNSGYNYTRVL